MRTLLTMAALAVVCFASTGQAALSLVSSVGGQPANGQNYINFDSVGLGGAGGSVATGVTLSFSPDGKVVQGSVSGEYAAPYLSNSNGVLFGNPNDGVDETPYVTSGNTTNPGGSATLTFASPQQYFGLLWGSVDTYNTLSFYDSSDNLLGSIVGSQVTASATGDQGINGTFYVNINSDVAFSKVVATSSAYAFEFDNVAYGPSPIPEAGSLAIWAVMGLVASFRFRRGSK